MAHQMTALSELNRTHLALLLSRVPGLGPKTLASVLPECCPESRALSAAELLPVLKKRRLPKRHIEFIAANMSALLSETEELAARLSEIGIGILTLWDADYPRGLKLYDDEPPPVLYAYGADDLLHEKKFAVINSNSPSARALELTTRISEMLIGEGLIPVTGHNRHPYQLVALTAKRLNSPVLIVLDRGIVSAFKGRLEWELFAGARIWSPEFDPSQDMVISQFRLGDGWIGDSSRRRDHTVLGLADVIVGVDIRPGGVMEKECLHALKMGREVYVCEDGQEGNTKLIEAGCARLNPAEAGSQIPAVVLEADD
jgi:predicted Rossmann fold nucleotide-binding protein DprA/Smf involved in DNA uptake